MLTSTDTRWLSDVVEAVRYQGFAVVRDVLDDALVQRSREALYRAKEGILRDVGADRLKRAGELGTLRIPFLYDPVFFEFLRMSAVLSLVDTLVEKTAILHQMNGFVLPSLDETKTPTTYQNSFHRDFPRYLDGYMASLNIFFAIDAFTEENGATLIVPGTHQRSSMPDVDYMEAHAVPIEAPAGSMLVFDSTLWHSAGRNRSGKDRLALNLQFTRSYIKQQIDYVRALGPDAIEAQPPRTQQLLGWYTRVVTSLDEYYRPEEERLYRRGQG